MKRALMLNLALVHSVEPFRSISKMFSQREIVNRKIPEGALLQFDWDGKSENLNFRLRMKKSCKVVISRYFDPKSGFIFDLHYFL